MQKIDSLRKNYSRRIGNEVGFLSHIIEKGCENVIQNSTQSGKIILADMNIQVNKAAARMQIVYLVNLFESFMEDFIISKDKIHHKQLHGKNFWSQYLSDDNKEWARYAREKEIPDSTSFMNMKYSLYILEKKYGIEFPSYFTPCISELGSLRNCLVHHDGNITKTDRGGIPFSKSLENTLHILGVDSNSTYLCELNKNKFLNKVIFDLQKFVGFCCGVICMPDLHESGSQRNRELTQ
jgi:hypothetical protein